MTTVIIPREVKLTASHTLHIKKPKFDNNSSPPHSHRFRLQINPRSFNHKSFLPGRHLQGNDDQHSSNVFKHGQPCDHVMASIIMIHQSTIAARRYAANITPQGESPFPKCTVTEARWMSGYVWLTWKRMKSRCTSSLRLTGLWDVLAVPLAAALVTEAAGPEEKLTFFRAQPTISMTRDAHCVRLRCLEKRNCTKNAE